MSMPVRSQVQTSFPHNVKVSRLQAQKGEAVKILAENCDDLVLSSGIFFFRLEDRK
jgi:hypothetical protein